MKYLIFTLFPCLLLGQSLTSFHGAYDGAKNIETVTIAPHRYNADFSWNSNTDWYPLDERQFKYAEAAHFKYNLGWTFFDNPTLSNGGTQQKRLDIYNAGRGEFALYFDLNNWIDNDTATLRAMILERKDSLSSVNPVTTISYRGGDTGGADTLTWLNEFLGGRNSGSNSQGGPSQWATLNDFYGYSFKSETLGRIVGDSSFYRESYTISQPSVSRFSNANGWSQGDSSTTAASVITAANYVKQVAGKRGFYDNFTHFHDQYSDGNWDWRNGYFYFLQNQRDTIDANNWFVFSDGYSSIIEYSYARDLVDSVWLHDIGDVVVLNVTYSDIEEINRSLINQPISVVINLENTVLAGVDITCECEGVRKISLDSFVVDISVPVDLSISRITINKAEVGNYYNFTVPTIDSVTYDNNILSVYTDIPTKTRVFYGDRNGAGDWDIDNAIRSGSAYATVHNIDISSIDITSKDLYIGVISKTKQSTLSEVIRY